MNEPQKHPIDLIIEGILLASTYEGHPEPVRRRWIEIMRIEMVEKNNVTIDGVTFINF